MIFNKAVVAAMIMLAAAASVDKVAVSAAKKYPKKNPKKNPPTEAPTEAPTDAPTTDTPSEAPTDAPHRCSQTPKTRFS